MKFSLSALLIMALLSATYNCYSNRWFNFKHIKRRVTLKYNIDLEKNTSCEFGDSTNFDNDRLTGKKNCETSWWSVILIISGCIFGISGISLILICCCCRESLKSMKYSGGHHDTFHTHNAFESNNIGYDNNNYAFDHNSGIDHIDDFDDI